MAPTITPGENDALLVIDVQNDFCPGGNLEVPKGDEVVPVINRLAERFPHVLLTQDWHTPGHQSFASSHAGKEPFETTDVAYGEQVLWPDHCVQGTPGAEFHPDLNIPHAELILRKGFRRTIDSYSAFFENDGETRTGLTAYLRERGFTNLYLAGLALDVCVFWSAEDGHKEGFGITVIDDSCRAIDMDGSEARVRKKLEELSIPLIDSSAIVSE